ncbi:hypothetical protein R1flu_010781 [Riccia fluitans]|uniref:Uncharacterized protein n=1 Tax=Riccia fluitans TaxID=41844 RepID=A0ABD1Z712_9MARC
MPEVFSPTVPTEVVGKIILSLPSFFDFLIRGWRDLYPRLKQTRNFHLSVERSKLFAHHSSVSACHAHESPIQVWAEITLVP